MDSWTLQTGFPVVTVTRDYAAGTAAITQERFVLTPDNGTRNEQLWWVPITYTTSDEKNFNSTQPRLWLRGERSASISGLPTGNNKWLQLNIQETGNIMVL
jgi:aminopeptidase N